MMKQAFARSKPDGIEISSERISPAKALRSANLNRPGNKEPEMVIDHARRAENRQREKNTRSPESGRRPRHEGKTARSDLTMLGKA